MKDFISLIGGPVVLIFIGRVIAAIGGIWSAIEQNQAGEKFDKKNEEIIQLNKAISSAVTGGDSFCYICVSFSKKPYFAAIHKGEYPVYDVAARVLDLDEFEKADKSHSDVLSLYKAIPLGNMAPHSSAMLGDGPQLESSPKRYNIFFSARNGFVNEMLRLRKDANGEWKQAIKVSRWNSDGSVTELHKEIPKDFPKTDPNEDIWI